MARINDNYRKLQAGYLFPEIGRRTREFAASNPDANVIRLGIGDITLPLMPVVVQAIQDAAAEMGRDDGVHGYGPEQGYEFLREARIVAVSVRTVRWNRAAGFCERSGGRVDPTFCL